MKNFLNWSKDFLQVGGTASTKQLTALIMLALVVTTHIFWLISSIKKDDWSMLGTVLTTDLGFIAIALGITAYAVVQKDKMQLGNGNGNGNGNNEIRGNGNQAPNNNPQQ